MPGTNNDHIKTLVKHKKGFIGEIYDFSSIHGLLPALLTSANKGKRSGNPNLFQSRSEYYPGYFLSTETSI